MTTEGIGDDASYADVFKAAGNELFQRGYFMDALDQYNDAIELRPEVRIGRSQLPHMQHRHTLTIFAL